MSYTATIPVEFTHPRHFVYEAFCDMGRHQEWNKGLTEISYKGRMYEGLKYATITNVLGKVSKSNLQVVKMVKDELIILESGSGIVTFRAIYEFKEVPPDSCNLTCTLLFTFSKAVFKLAEPVVVTVAENIIRGDLETLRASLV